MIAALALLCASALPQDAAGDEAEGRAQEDAGTPACTLAAQPAEAAIGEPIDWILTVRHSARDAVRLADEDPLPDDTWVLVDGPRFSTERAGGEATTRIRWTVFSLEPGERSLPEISARLDSGAEVRATHPGTIVVRGELAADEDAPRPLTGFHDVEERTGNGGALVAAITALLAASAVLWFVLRKRRGQVTAPVLTPLERLDALGGKPADEPEVARAMVYELSSLLREAVDRRLDTPLPGLTDEEWLERVRENGVLGRDSVERLERLLGSCEDVKYGSRVPTRFAVAEALDEARRVLVALDGVEGAAA